MCPGARSVITRHLGLTGVVVILIGTVNAILLPGRKMFKDKEFLKNVTLKIAKHAQADPVTELIYWAKLNLDNAEVKDFTRDHFEDADFFNNALKNTIQELGIEDEEGRISNFAFFIAGADKNKLYLAGVIPLTLEHKEILKTKLKMETTPVDEGLFLLNWL